MTKYETTTEETEILVLEARIDELEKFKSEISLPPDCSDICEKKHWHHVARTNADYRIAELTTQLQALKEKARVS